MEVTAALAIVLALVGAVVAILRVRPDTADALASLTGRGLAANAPAQLALGGTATTIPTLTATVPVPTATAVPPTVAPTATVLQPVAQRSTPTVPQTGGPPPRAETQYVIQAGDTLLAIAYRFGVTLDDLLTANNFSGTNALLLPGQPLVIPAESGADSPAQAAAPTATAVPAGPTSPPTETPEPTDTPEPAPEGRVTYTIQGGDSLWGIANRFDTTVEELVRINKLKSPNEFLGIGQEIVVKDGPIVTPKPTNTPRPTRTPVPTATPLPTATATTAPTNTPAPSPTAIPLSVPTQIAAAPATGETAAAAPARPGGSGGSGGDTGAAAASTAMGGPAPAAATPTDADAALFRYPSPTLLGVPDKMALQGQQLAVLLNWTSVGVLAADEYYVVRVSTILDGKPTTEENWVKATGWRIPDAMRPPSKATAPVTYIWDVTVRKATGTGPDGRQQTGPALSPTSSVYEFTWAP